MQCYTYNTKLPPESYTGVNVKCNCMWSCLCFMLRVLISLGFNLSLMHVQCTLYRFSLSSPLCVHVLCLESWIFLRWRTDFLDLRIILDGEHSPIDWKALAEALGLLEYALQSSPS